MKRTPQHAHGAVRDAHRNGAPEEALDVARTRGRGEVPVSRVPAGKRIAHRPAHGPGLEPGVLQTPRDADDVVWRAKVRARRIVIGSGHAGTRGRRAERSTQIRVRKRLGETVTMR